MDPVDGSPLTSGAHGTHRPCPLTCVETWRSRGSGRGTLRTIRSAMRPPGAAGRWAAGRWAAGPWEAGPWEAGPWEAGPWEAGPWEAGPWEAGPWEAGPWEAGPWEAGPWEAGPWEAGPWEAGKARTRSVVHAPRSYYRCLDRHRGGGIARGGVSPEVRSAAAARYRSKG